MMTVERSAGARSLGNISHASFSRTEAHCAVLGGVDDFFFSTVKVKVKEADLYSAFIEVPYPQGAQVQITQCYL